MKGEPPGMKKRWLTGMLVLALLVPVMVQVRAQAQEGSSTALKQPAIEIPSMSYNFGDVYHQDKYVHAFTIKNKGSGDLVINDVKPG